MNFRLRKPAGALLTTALAASLLGFVPAADAAPQGTISGVVTGSGGVLDGVAVDAYVLEGGWWRHSDGEGSYTSTESDGSYTLTLPPGAYRIGYRDAEGAFIAEFFDDAANVDAARTLTLDDGDTLTASADLAEASHITGTITGPGASTPASVAVQVYRKLDVGSSNAWQQVGTGTYDSATGTYDVGGLPAGDYRIGFVDASGWVGQAPTLAREFYDDATAVDLATTVTVAPVETVSDVDIELGLDSTITGRVTDAAGEPIDNAHVTVATPGDDGWEYLDYVKTGDDGTYLLTGLRPGTYRVSFDSGDAYEVWDDAGRIEEGRDIVLGLDEDRAGIDATMVAGEHDPLPFLEGLTVPMISGTPQVGSPLTVTTGTWNAVEVSATYQWWNNGGAIPGATANTYSPTAADLGKILFVVVQASAPGFQDRTTFSNVVGPVVAAPVVTPPVVGPSVVTPPVVAPPVATPPAPVISFSKKIDVAGALKVGSTLKLKNFKALVSRATVSYQIQWFADSKKIKKATKSKLKVTKALKNKLIKVTVSATSGGTTRTVTVRVGKIR